MRNTLAWKYICFARLLVRKDTVEIFDPLKDFIRLPCTMHHQMSANGKSVGLDKIFIEGPVLRGEDIAIFK